MRKKQSKRKMKGSGWVNYEKHPRGPNGRGLCRMCNEEVPKGRRTFCSEKCVHQYRLRNDTRYQAQFLTDRDASVCAVCGINAAIVRATYLEEKSKIHKTVDNLYWMEELDSWKKNNKLRSKKLEELKKKYRDQGWTLRRGRWWDVDHILPVSEGGGPQEWPTDKDYSENLRTLCTPCHKEETAKLRKRLAKNK